jgi:hypothetical protein
MEAIFHRYLHDQNFALDCVSVLFAAWLVWFIIVVIVFCWNDWIARFRFYAVALWTIVASGTMGMATYYIPEPFPGINRYPTALEAVQTMKVENPESLVIATKIVVEYSQ